MSLFIYTYLLLPLVYVATHFVALFSSKVRYAIAGRYKALEHYRVWVNALAPRAKIVYVHAASMGEFEHVKPLINGLKKEHGENIQLVVSFFSPSGYDNVKAYEGVDLFIYLPFDFPFVWKKLFHAKKPVCLLISKHDVWPNMVRACKKHNIPSYLLNASLAHKSSRTYFPSRWFLAPAYGGLSGIYAISGKDAQRFKEIFGCTNVSINGDTKFDQVFARREQSQNRTLLNRTWVEDTVILFGSIWPQDAENILPGMENLLQARKNLRLLLVPHQPTKEVIDQLNRHFKNTRPTYYSKDGNQASSRVLIIDKIGLLADLYRYADIAYVGGSYKQGIHNVMEPAVYGLPVVFGPRHDNAYEALELHAYGGGLVITPQKPFLEIIERLLDDSDHRALVGRRAAEFAKNHTGATKTIIEDIKPLL